MRKARAKKRPITPDPKYKNELVSRFVNNLMNDGKKSTAYRIFYDALDLIEKRTEESGLEVFQAAINNVMPGVEVKSRRVGGSTFQVPTEVKRKSVVQVRIMWAIPT